MTIHAALLSVWRKLPLSPQQKMRLKSRLVRKWPQLQPVTATPVVADLVGNTTVASVKPLVLATRKPWIARNTPLGQRDWIIFGIIGWNFRIQRPQHLARELARAGDTVFYIEPDFIADDQAGFSIRQIDAFIDDTMDVTEDDKLITLETGVSDEPDQRYLVQAVLVEEQ